MSPAEIAFLGGAFLGTFVGFCGGRVKGREEATARAAREEADQYDRASEELNAARRRAALRAMNLNRRA